MAGTPISGDVLAEQMVGLFANGGTLGDVFDYTQQDYEALYALGHGLYANARYLDAAKAFGFLVMSDPYERRFVNAFAAALQMLEQYKDAISHYTTASIMDLSDPAPTFHIAECLIPLGMVTEARRALGFVLAQCTRPNHAALKERARALLELLDPGIK